MKFYDVAIIGAGVIGCSIARELSRYQGSVCVLEKNTDVCEGSSKANSAIIHGGYDPLPGTRKAKLNVLGNQMMDQISEELDIPFQRIGALVLCFEDSGREQLAELMAQGVENGVSGLEVLEREALLQLEPGLSGEVLCALHVPSSGIVCPFEMTMGYAENAAENGTDFYLGTSVIDIRQTESGYEIITENKPVFAKALVNAAGVNADEIHNLVCEDQITIRPKAGDYLLLDKGADGVVTRTVFQLPNRLGKGVLVTPTVHGNLLLGPSAVESQSKEAGCTTSKGLHFVEEMARLGVEELPIRQVITSFSGLRAYLEPDQGKPEDFLIDETAPLFFEAAGIDSPGLSSAPAISLEVAGMVAQRLKLTKKETFQPLRKKVRRMAALSIEERKKAIKDNPAYGAIVCRCEEISEGEILDAIQRPLGARTLDGVKRRTRAGMGRCQGGFCATRVMELLERETRVKMQEIEKNQWGSQLVLAKTRGRRGGGR